MFEKLKAKLAGMHRSATIIFNTAMAALLQNVPDLVHYLHDSLGELQQYTPATFYKWLGIVVLAGNIVLRFKTKKALEDK